MHAGVRHSSSSSAPLVRWSGVRVSDTMARIIHNAIDGSMGRWSGIKGREQSARMAIQQPGTRAAPSAWLRVGEAPVLSVIVPTRNEADNIRPLLVRLEDALARHRRRGAYCG